jgi:hypothetical protein
MINQPYNQYEPYTDVVYRLTGYGVRHPEDEYYPKFNLHKIEGSIHRTLEDAKTRMNEIVDNAVINNNFIKWHSFYIAEVPIGVCCFDMYDGQKLWSFTGKGEYVAHKSVSSLEDINGNHEIYWGREEEDCRFKVGDVVEMHCGKYSALGMICRMPIDYEFAKKNLPTEKPAEPLTYHIDYSDDMYQVVSIDSEYIDYVDVIDCFPPETLPLDESLVRKLKKKSAELN